MMVFNSHWSNGTSSCMKEKQYIPYKKDNISSVNTTKKFDVEDLFELEKMAFAVEFALVVAEKDTSAVQMRNKQDLYHALIDRETLYKVLYLMLLDV